MEGRASAGVISPGVRHDNCDRQNEGETAVQGKP